MEELIRAKNYTLPYWAEISISDRTGGVLQELGLNDLPLMYSQQHFHKAVAEFDDHDHTHGMPVETIAEFADLLKDPIAVFDSGNCDDAVCVYTKAEVTGEHGEPTPLLITIRTNGMGKTAENGQVRRCNFILSAYGKREDGFAAHLEYALKDHRLLYVDKAAVLERLDRYSKNVPGKSQRHFLKVQMDLFDEAVKDREVIKLSEARGTRSCAAGRWQLRRERRSMMPVRQPAPVPYERRIIVRAAMAAER